MNTTNKGSNKNVITPQIKLEYADARMIGEKLKLSPEFVRQSVFSHNHNKRIVSKDKRRVLKAVMKLKGIK